MKKVMHVIHGLSTGGAETLIKDYALKLDKEKFSVVVLCFKHYSESPYEKLLESNGIKVLYVCDNVKTYKRKGVFFKILNRINKYYTVKKIIRDEKPDIIHSHLFVNQYLKFARPRKEVKLFYTVHNDPNILWRKDNFERKIEFKATKWLVERYKMRFIVLHEKMRLEINDLFNVSNSIILKNGIDFNRFVTNHSKSDIRKMIGIPNSAFVVGHVGRFSYQKNHEFLINVFYELYKKNSDAFLLLIGDGLEKNKIDRMLQELKLNGRYLILSNRADIPDLLNSMDVFVFPSRFEGLGISLIEAQKMKLPCFISDCVPDDAIISNLVTRLSLLETYSSWASKIINYSYPKSVEIDDENWNMDVVINKLADIYLNII